MKKYLKNFWKKYGVAWLIAFGILIVAMAVYLISSFSSTNESIALLQKNPNVEKVWFAGDKNILNVKCRNNKELTIELEDGPGRYEPVTADFCR